MTALTASEIVATSLALAFHDLGLVEVAAFTRPENDASSRVLRRAGFTFLRHVPELERDLRRVNERLPPERRIAGAR